MKNTKQEILNTARKLFNDQGYSQVTIRMIATALGMSSGNLNYHFRKREDILEALYFAMVATFDRRVQTLEDQVISLKHMKMEVQSSMERMVEYRFFWTDLYNLLKANKKIEAHFQAVRQDRINGYRFVFQSLINQQKLLAPSFPQEHWFLIQRMIDYSNTWLYVSVLADQEVKGAKLIEQSSFQLMSMLHPYLTQEGRSQFKSIFPTFFT